MKELSTVKKGIAAGKYDDRLTDIYVDETLLSCQRERYLKAIAEFERLYGSPKAEIYSAPGRSEVMGNHTDHQHGEILAAGVNLDAIAVVSPQDDMIRLTSGDSKEIRLRTGDLKIRKAEFGTTRALIKGVLKGFADRGYRIGGFMAYVTSDVLMGAGLSSSAAFETLIGAILNGLYNKGKVSDIDIAIIGQYAENVYFGKPCGLMDQMACSVASLVHVDLTDPADPGVEKVEIDLSAHGYSLCITDTKGSHADLTEEYAAIPKEMKEVAGFFGQDVLLGITVDELLANAEEIRKNFGDRAFLRAIHFIQENERVRRGVAALKKEKIADFLNEVRASGNSSFKFLQNVYPSSDIRHQNVSVALAVSETVLDPKKDAARVHGGGFAGTIQAFVQNGKVAEYQKAMESVFGCGSCHVLKIRKYGGIKVM